MIRSAFVTIGLATGLMGCLEFTNIVQKGLDQPLTDPNGQVEPLEISLSRPMVAAGTPDNEIVFTVSGGTPPYSVTVVEGKFSPGSTALSVQAPDETDYSLVEIKDAEGVKQFEEVLSIAGAEYWFSAQFLEGVDGDKVSVLPDGSGSGNEPLQLTVEKQASLITNVAGIQGDLNAVVFDPSDGSDCYEFPEFLTSLNVSIIAFYRSRTISNQTIFNDDGVGTNYFELSTQVAPNGANALGTDSAGTSISHEVIASTLNWGGLAYFTAIPDTNGGTLHSHGDTESTGTDGFLGFDLSGTTLGAPTLGDQMGCASADRGFDAELMEFIVYDETLDLENTLDILCFFHVYYGLNNPNYCASVTAD